MKAFHICIANTTIIYIYLIIMFVRIIILKFKLSLCQRKISQSMAKCMCADLYLVTYLLPNKMPCSLDPFLHPLVTEIEDTFIDDML